MDKSGLKDIRVKVGETIKFETKIGGEPPPEITWEFVGKPLKSGGRVKVTADKAKAGLRIDNAERADSGKYTLKLKNASGEESASANVIVVCKFLTSCRPHSTHLMFFSETSEAQRAPGNV